MMKRDQKVEVNMSLLEIQNHWKVYPQVADNYPKVVEL